MPIALPVCNSDETWLRPSQFKSVVGRSKETIIKWCNDGTIFQFGYSAYQDPFGHWFIKTPIYLIPSRRAIRA